MYCTFICDAYIPCHNLRLWNTDHIRGYDDRKGYELCSQQSLQRNFVPGVCNNLVMNARWSYVFGTVGYIYQCQVQVQVLDWYDGAKGMQGSRVFDHKCFCKQPRRPSNVSIIFLSNLAWLKNRYGNGVGLIINLFLLVVSKYMGRWIIAWNFLSIR